MNEQRYKISVRVFQAKQGDSFLITLQKCNEEINIMIDFGTYNTYFDYIRPVLLDMNKHKKQLDFVILTHTHSDHIGGAVPFFIENGSNEDAHIIKIGTVIYNGFLGLNLKDYSKRECDFIEKQIYEGICAQGQAILLSEIMDKPITLQEDVCLSHLIIKGEYCWNGSISKPYSIVVSDMLEKVNVNENMSIHILSPDTCKLKRMNNKWEEYLKRIRSKFQYIDNELVEKAYEAFMMISENENIDKLNTEIGEPDCITHKSILRMAEAKVKYDDSEENGTSIAVLIQVGSNNLLFLSDAHPEICIQSLDKIFKDKDKVTLDFIKLAHHGSSRNISDEFFDKYDSSRYLISASGAYGHPNAITLAKIISRCTKDTRIIYFTNMASVIQSYDQDSFKKEYNYELKKVDNQIIEL